MVATPLLLEAMTYAMARLEILLDTHDMGTAFPHVIRQAKADGEIYDNDLEEIKELVRALAVMGDTVMSRIEAMHANGKAALKAVK